MNAEDKEELKIRINSGHDISLFVKSTLPTGTFSRTANLVVDANNPGFVIYCPGGIDPQTGQCRNTGLAIPDPLGHLAGMLLLKDA